MDKCVKCEVEVKPNVVDFSNKKYGTIYCYNCQKSIDGIAPAKKDWKPKQTTWKPKEGPNEKALTMLVSYAKDQVIAGLNKLQTAPENVDLFSALWSKANEDVWVSYNFFKQKLGVN